jgi:peptide/nickel transport system permease protein
MGGYLLKRLLMLPPVLLGVTVIVFLVMALIPGDPAMAILGTYATPENLAQVRLELGLNHPLPIRYLFWLNAVLHGNLGWSYILHKPVVDEVMARLGPTMLLAGASLVLCAIVGIPLGIIAAVRQNAWEDKLITVTVLVGVSTPSFWLGMLLILWFAVRLQWLPDGGMYDLFGDGGIVDLLTHLALPARRTALIHRRAR